MKYLEMLLSDHRRAALFVAVIAGLVYANTLSNRFAYDDYHIIVHNTALQSMETLPSAVFSPYWPGMFGREAGLWRPTTQALFGLQWIAADGAPWLFHGVNLLAHAGVSALVLLVLLELMSGAAAMAGALIFAVHPVHVEAVANIVGLSEITSAGFFLAACLIHLRGPAESKWGRAVALGALYTIAFGSKEGAVTLPAVIFLLDAARGHLGWRDLPKYLMERWRAYTAMVISAGFLLLVRWEILGTIANPIEPLGTDLLLEVPRIWTIAEVWGNYVRLWILPLDLSSDYAPNVIPVSLGWNTANTTGLLLTIAVLVASLASWRIGKMRKGRDSARVAGFGVVWFMLTISPVANVFFLAGVLLAERTLYLPSVGLAAASGWLVARLARSRPTGAAVLLSTLLTLGAARTWLRNPTWQDNPTWLNTLVGDYPQSGRSQWVLGDAFLDFGQTSEALNSYSLALDLLDSHYQVMTDVSQTFINKEMYGPAEGLLQHAWRRDPSFALAPAMLAQIYSELGQPDRAERFSRLALTIDDRDPLRPHILSWSLAARGQYEAAEAARAKAVASQGMGNYWQAWLTLAYLNANTGDTASARNAFDGALATNLSETARTLVDSVRLSVLGPVTDSTELSNRP